METGLEEFEDVTVKTRNVEWEGDIYIELYPFTKRTYDLFLVGFFHYSQMNQNSYLFLYIHVSLFEYLHLRRNNRIQFHSILYVYRDELHYDIYFNKSDINQTTYYKYCDTNKISFKDFKEIRTDIPLIFFNICIFFLEFIKVFILNISSYMTRYCFQ